MNRIGTGLAALAGAALIGAPTVASAAAPLPDLSLSLDHSAGAEVDNDGLIVGVHVANHGTVPATAVTVKVDLSKLGDEVVATVPDESEQCRRSADLVTCAVGQVTPAGEVDVFAVRLAGRDGAEPGPAGEVAVTVDGAEDDANPADDVATFPVTVIASDPRLVVEAADLNTAKTPVGPGDEKAFRGAVFNEGDAPAIGGTITVSLHSHATFVERYTDCVYEDDFPDDVGGEYVYGPNRMTCELPVLAPNTGLLFYNPGTGESAFHLRFGRNLPGPDELTGEFAAQQPAAAAPLAARRAAAGDGPTLAEALAKLQPSTGRAAAPAVLSDAEPSDNVAFRFWTEKNTLDVQVKADPVTGKAGQTVNLTYEVVNQGPSDGGGPSILITAPAGTVLLPAQWCWTDGTDHERRPESKRLRCAVESQFLAVASGHGKFTQTVKLKITSTPGTNGTIYAESCCVGSTDSKKSNNTAKIVFSTGGGTMDTGGAGGGSLPITGSPVALIAAGGAVVIVLGVVLTLVFRRKRVVVETPKD